MKVERYVRFFVIAFLFLQSVSALFAQAPSGVLRGQITDQSAAVISGASVIMTPATGSPIVVQSNAQGMYEFKALPAGKYVLTVAAPGFTLFENDNVVISDQPLRLNVSMSIEVEQQKIQVSDTAPTVDVNPTNNAGAITLSGKELEALPDDPDELQSDLEALAGPSAGPNGGQMYIDGFTAGQLPPKSSIREIRINQNPFAAEFDKVGYGRIEIFTKPGTYQWHGQISVNENDAALNARDPFATTNAGFKSTQVEGNIGGPLGKKASLFFNIENRDIHDQALVNAFTLGANCNQGVSLLQVSCRESLSSPRARLNGGPRIDYQLTKNNTFSARYQFFRNRATGNGV